MVLALKPHKTGDLSQKGVNVLTLSEAIPLVDRLLTTESASERISETRLEAILGAESRLRRQICVSFWIQI
jgi:hypothetical protein